MNSAVNNNNTTTTPSEEDDANLSKFRRRNNILILVFATFSISLTLTISALIFNLVRHVDSESGHLTRLNPAVRAFYEAAICNTPSCREAFNPIINNITRTRSIITDPNQIFILSLQAAAEQLQNITITTDKNCSDSLRFGSDQIRYVLATVRGDPFVEKRSFGQRVAIVEGIGLAEDDLNPCVDYLLDDVESTAVREVRAKVLRVMVYLSSSREFAGRFYEEMHQRYRDVAVVDWRNMVSDHMFIICICGLQLLFIFFLYWTLFRFG
ncbi:hypothetical protein ABFS83_09G036100 [Erythranthe nasuta]